MSVEYVPVESSYLYHKGKPIHYVECENKVWVNIGVILTVPKKLSAYKNIRTSTEKINIPFGSAYSGKEWIDWYQIKVPPSKLHTAYHLEYVPFGKK